MNNVQEKEQKDAVMDGYSMLNADILFYDRPAKPTPFQEQEAFTIARELLLTHDCQKVILDLSRARRISLETRHIVQASLPKISSLIDHLVIIINSTLIRSAVRFILLPLKLECKLSVVGSQEEALELLK